MTLHLWREEFGDDWAVPAVISNDPALDETSWHNDVCPSFVMLSPFVTFADRDDDIRLWVDHPDPAMREFSEAPRFRVCNNDGDVLFESEDDPTAAVAALKQAVSGL